MHAGDSIDPEVCPHTAGPAVACTRELKDRRIIEALAVISSEYHTPLTPAGLARRLNLSASRLHELFRRQTDTTPHAVIMAKRMEKAAELLRNTHLRVKEVAAKVGIQNDSHFVRDFQETYGLSPVAYRGADPQPALRRRRKGHA